jgi:hypothetical protein
LLLAGTGFAQTTNGSILGTVTDTSGGVVAGAVITVTNLGTSERRQATSDAQGNYRFLDIPPGRYRVDVESPGFKHLTRDQLLVEVQSTIRIDPALEVGDTRQVVEVQASTPLLQSESATLSQVVEAKTVNEMPLNGRNVFSLMALVPGVVPQGNTGSAPSTLHPNATGNFQISGGIANQSASFLDGAPLNIGWVNMVALVPAQDIIQEFRVQTNDAGAEYGRFAGGVMSLVTKSGTNQLHGTVYEFLRNKVLNANPFFNNRSGLPRPPFTQNQFGATAGGPIIKDKTFFYVGYEGFRLAQGRTFLSSVPSADFRNGDFSNLRSASGALIPIYDPLTTCSFYNNPACASPTAYTRQPFPNNVIPVNRQDPTARILTRYWALPNRTGQPFTQIQNFATSVSAPITPDQFNFRGDHTLSVKQRMFGRYTHWGYDIPPFDFYGTGILTRSQLRSQQAVFGDTYAFSPSMVADLRVSYLRYIYRTRNESLGTDLTKIGWSPSLIGQMLGQVIPATVVQGFNDVITGAVVSYLDSVNNSYSIAPSMTKITGAHTIKFGGELRRLDYNYAQTNTASGSFTFDNLFTAVNPLAAAGTGYGYASYMLGYGSTGSLQQAPRTAARIMYQGYYVSDSFQVSRKLTLSAGLRWELPGPWTERYDRLTVLLPLSESPLAAPTGLPLKGKLAVVNSPDWPSRYNMHYAWRLFAPRLGAAFRATGNTVIRAGYGISYLPNDVTLYSGPFGSAVNNATTSWVPTLNGELTPQATLHDPFPNGLLQPPGHDPSFQSVLEGQTISAPIPSNPYAYIQQWNFTIQHQFGDGMLVQAGYVGSKGTHLPAFAQQLNQLSTQQLALGAQLLQQVKNPFFGLVSSGPLAGPTVPYGQLLRPFPQYNGVNVEAVTNRSSIYHSMEVKMEKRFHEAGTVLASYTFSKLIADVDQPDTWLETTGVGGGIGAVQDTFNLRNERALASFDARSRLVLSYALDLPVGKGKRFLGGIGGVTNKFVGGWGIDGVSTFQAGFPLFFTAATNTSNSYNIGPLRDYPRPNVTAGCAKAIDGSAQSRLNKWFNTSCFSQPAAFTFGTESRVDPNLRGAGINNFDFSLFKNTTITERVKLQFRGEFFNLFNRAQFSFPGTAFGNPQFGVVSAQLNNPRLVQLSLRLQY